MNIKPNLFILGAPKCGTTALATYLNQHSKVGMCKYKEPYYFADEYRDMHKALNLEEYKKLYGKKTLFNKIVFEATTHYLMSTTAIENILAFNPEAKFICMFRNPYELIPSWHDELTYLGHQNLGFNEALENAEQMNKELKWNQNKYKDSRMMFDYLYVASNGRHMQRLLNKVDSNRVKCIKFEDFITDTETVFKNICKFLDLPMEKVELKKINARKYHKYPEIVSFIRKAGKLTNYIGVKKTGLVNKIISIQLDKSKKERAVEYTDYYITTLNSDIKLLQDMTKLKIRDWIKD